MGIPSEQERDANIRRLAEEGRTSALRAAQLNAGFLARREAMLSRIAAEDEERSRITQQEAQYAKNGSGVLHLTMPEAAVDEPPSAA